MSQNYRRSFFSVVGDALLTGGIITLLFLFGFFVSTLGNSQEITATKTETVVVIANDYEKAVNDLRHYNDLQRLNPNNKLRESACLKAEHMIDRDYWAHNSPDGTEPWHFFTTVGYEYKIAGENLARGYDSADDVLTAWYDSPSHRNNILGDYREQGICAKDGMYMGKVQTLIVQHLGSK